MNKEDFINKISEIGSCTDDVQRRSQLTELQDEMIKVYDDAELNKTTINTLNDTILKNNEQITSLQEANMKYFLKLQEQNKTQNQINQDSTGIADTESNKKRKFEDLFKEGGN